MAASPEQIVAKTLISAVPQWFEATDGPERYVLKVGESEFPFYSFRRLTPNLGTLFDYTRGVAGNWLEYVSKARVPSQLEALQELLAVKWLTIRAPDIDWHRVLGYLSRAQRRTYENGPIVKNLVLTTDESGEQMAPALDEEASQKLLDPLASSPHVYLRVDRDLRLVNLEEVRWSEVDEPASYTLYPTFVHPIVSNLGFAECSVHLTQRGDVVIAKDKLMIAAKRKSRWYLYDGATMKNALVDVMGKRDYGLSCHMFRLLFDLSYRRHGALLVLDPDGTVLSHVSNKGSRSASGGDVPPGEVAFLNVVSFLTDASGVQMRPPEGVMGSGRNRVLAELASIDGAVLFQDERVTAVGGMIAAHPDVTSVDGIIGARTTAAMSAYLHGGTPFKVSADGDISILFHADKNKSRVEGRAKLSFL